MSQLNVSKPMRSKTAPVRPRRRAITEHRHLTIKATGLILGSLVDNSFDTLYEQASQRTDEPARNDRFWGARGHAPWRAPQTWFVSKPHFGGIGFGS